MAKIKRTKRQVLTIIYKALHRKLKVEQHKPHQYQGKTQVLRKGKQFLFH